MERDAESMELKLPEDADVVLVAPPLPRDFPLQIPGRAFVLPRPATSLKRGVGKEER
jgi:hypothetical protein